jgi:hypothetical protein
MHLYKDKDSYVLLTSSQDGERGLSDISLTSAFLLTTIVNTYIFCCFQQDGVIAYSFLHGNNVRRFQ